MVEVDEREIGGTRNWEWIKKGIPVRAEIGPRDMQEDSVFMARRDLGHRDKRGVKREELLETLPAILDEMQQNLFDRAVAYRDENTRPVDTKEDFYAWFTPKSEEKPEIHAGFALSHWCGSGECEETIKKDLSVTIRCIPFDAVEEEGTCICCGKPSTKRVIFAKSY